ncbi:hypothetical protein [Tenacibaculum xiamenense]|uniref:hypothetical protein n=1 Tax=Tenacibaculum xiamenense TaxID=1261553 RepID=UPI003895D64A
MKNILTLTLGMLLVIGCNGQHHNGKGHSSHSSTHNSQSSKYKQKNIEILASETIETFPTVGFKAVYKDTIAYSVNNVFPLFEPRGRKLLYSNWDPIELKKGEKGTLKGQVLFSKYDDLDVMLTVTDYNPEKGHIQYLVIWDDFEIQRIDIYCTQGKTKNATEITWLEYNAGLYEKGTPLVSKFIEEGYIFKIVKRYLTNIKHKLDNEN